MSPPQRKFQPIVLIEPIGVPDGYFFPAASA
jgi:hypothetical protein